jgi:uncharacterized integral membrane protein (TIGR00697 family)
MSHAPHHPVYTPPEFTASTRLYIWLSALFVTCLLLANILGVKLFIFEVPFFGWTIEVEHTVGMMTFPITFVLTDLLNEYYGNKIARRTAYLAFAMGLLTFGLIWVARQIPINTRYPGTATQDAFENIFGSAALMYLASMIAFLLGSILDVALFTVFKRWTGGKMVWFRATGSTIISQLFDSFAVTWLFFLFFPLILSKKPVGLGDVVNIAFTGYALKFVFAIVATPVIYAGRWMIHEWVGMQPLPPDR